MTVAIGPVLLLLASILLSAVLLLGAFGIMLWATRHQGRARHESGRRIWERDPTDTAGRDGTSLAAPGK